MKAFERYVPTSDMRTFTDLSEAVAFRRSGQGQRLANTTGYDYYAEIIGYNKAAIINTYQEYNRLKGMYSPNLWAVAGAVFKFITHNPIGGAIDAGRILSEHVPKWREVDEIILNDPNLKLIWKALQDDGEIDYDIESGRFFLRVKLYLENIDSGW